MVDFQFPVKLPRWTDAEFKKKQEAYVAKHGYTINIPAFTDIVKLGHIVPPTEAELKLYRAKDREAVGEVRYSEIETHMTEKKASFLRMLQSPQPTWMKNIASALTFLDDINDTMGTLGVVLRTAAHLLPAAAGKVLMGPAGWALTAADIADIALTISRAPLKAIPCKRNSEKTTSLNPFSSKSKVKRAAKLRRLNPSRGEIIEALQTSDNMVGIGLCLGPIFGLAGDLAVGAYRVARGEEVHIKLPPPSTRKYEMQSTRMMKAVMMVNTGLDELSEREHTRSYVAINLASVSLYPYLQEWHPLDAIDNVNGIEIQAPIPYQPSTLALLEDEGIRWQDHVGFLWIDKPFARIDELWEATMEKCIFSFQAYCERNKHNYEGLLGSQAAVMFSQNVLALCEGEEAVVLDYHPVSKAVNAMFYAGDRFHPNTTKAQIDCFAAKCEAWGNQGLAFEWRDIKERTEALCEIVYTKEVPTW